ncbi:hypothetical protein LSAT2_012894, partial [Lamellibrachia satsuma]
VFTIKLDVFTIKLDVFTIKLDVFTSKLDVFTIKLDVFLSVAITTVSFILHVQMSSILLNTGSCSALSCY